MNIHENNIELHLKRVLDGLNEAEVKYREEMEYLPKENTWHSVERKKFIAIDCDTSGAFLIEKSTGDIFNIKGYGKPDRNKKVKADLGNIFTVNPSFLHARRHNYLPKGRTTDNY